MEENYKKSENHCDISYKIKDRFIKISNLTDTQLEISNKNLSSRKYLSKKQNIQLYTIKVEIRNRSKLALQKLESDIIDIRINKAKQKADIITNWIIKIMNKN